MKKKAYQTSFLVLHLADVDEEGDPRLLEADGLAPDVLQGLQLREGLALVHPRHALNLVLRNFAGLVVCFLFSIFDWFLVIWIGFHNFSGIMV